MGFVSINGFEIKISGGNGEVCVSRDLYRVATRSDFFRMMSIYYSGPGFFINNAILMTTVYLQTWVLVVLALAGAYLISSGALRESEGIGLKDKNDTKVPSAPGEDVGTRRLLEISERNLLQYYYGSTADPAPEKAAPTAPKENPPGNQELFDSASYTDAYYATLNNDVPANEAYGADTGGANDVISSYYTDFGSYDQPASSSSGSGASSSNSGRQAVFSGPAVSHFR